MKKWEEELKQKEIRNADLEKDVKKLEDYLSKTEARNLELESTVRTLQRKIHLLEGSPVVSQVRDIKYRDRQLHLSATS